MSRAAWIPGIVCVALAVFGAPSLNPDAMEMVDVGRCSLGVAPTFVDCASLELSAYPPLYPLLSGALSVVFGPWAAAVVASALGAGLLALGMGLLAGRLLPGALPIAASMVVLFPAFRFYGLASDPRLGALGLGLLSWAILLDRESPRSRWVAGALAGLAVWMRPEGIVHAALFGAGALLLTRKALPALLGVVAVAGSYLAWLALHFGTLSLSARSWELKGAPLLDLFPVRWLIQLWGVGATAPPFRSWLQQAEAGAVQSMDPLSSLFVVGRIFQQEVPWQFHCLALAGAGVALAGGGCRRTLVALGLVSVPAVGLGLSPMGLDLGMPLKNLLPVLAVEAILGAVALAALAGRLPGRWARLGSWGVVVVLAVAWLPRTHLDGRFWPAMSEEAEQAAAWLSEQTPPEALVGATFSSGPVVRRGGRRLAVVPSPWEMARWEADPPAFLVVTSIDGIWPLRSPDLAVLDATPAAFFATAKGWAMVLAVR
jgi:hypothetical protein